MKSSGVLWGVAPAGWWRVSAWRMVVVLACLVPGGAGAAQDEPIEEPVVAAEASEMPVDAEANDPIQEDVSAPLGEAEGTQDEPVPSIQRTEEGRIRFSFVNAPWKDVITWFAEQAEFSLQPIETAPEGTFEYHDDAEYSVMEAIDQLNYALGLKGYTLLRNKKMLVLATLDQRIPDDLIETITPEELPYRGKHEVLKCVFELHGLEDSEIQRQIESLISRTHREAFHVIPSAGQMIIRESGQTLRTIDTLLAAARLREGAAVRVTRKYELKHIDPETVFAAAQVLLDFDPTINRTADDSLRVMVEPLSTRLIFRGTESKVQQFMDLISELDVPGFLSEGAVAEEAFLKQYPVRGDLDTVFKIVQTMMANRDVRFDIDRTAGIAVLLGRQVDHDRLAEVLNELTSGSSDFAVVELKELSTSRAITMLEQIFQRDTADEETPAQGPVFFSDDLNNRIVVKGTPQEVDNVRRYLLELDVKVTLNTGPRSRTRIIPADSSRVSEELLEDYFSVLGRENRLRIVMPRGENRRGVIDERLRRESEPEMPDDAEAAGETGEGERAPSNGGSSPPAGSDDGARASSLERGFTRTLMALPVLALTGSLWQETAAPAANAAPSRVADAQDEPAADAAPATDETEQELTVPGADMEVRVTDYGIVLNSDDLDALDDFETFLKTQLEEASEYGRPAVFYLQYRDPLDAKSMLEELLGQSSSSSGGGGDPLTSLLGAGINNMIPGMGDLFGGGSSGSSSGDGAVYVTEAPVVIHADTVLRSLIVSATARDMDVIEELITTYIDQPGAPHDPKIQGEFYAIPIVHRDPTELKTMLEQMLPDLIRSEDQAAGQNNQQAMEQQLLRALMRGAGKVPNRRKTNRPRPCWGSTKGRALLVSGPPFIYQQILAIVEKLDSPELSAESFAIVPLGGIRGEMIAEGLKASLGDKIEISDSPPSTTGGTRSTAQGAGGGGETIRSAASNKLSKRRPETR